MRIEHPGGSRVDTIAQPLDENLINELEACMIPPQWSAGTLRNRVREGIIHPYWFNTRWVMYDRREIELIKAEEAK